MSKPRLIYFDFAGSRGEECRIALHLAGIDFEDVRVKRGDWPAMKADMPFGRLPVLELPGEVPLAHSNAILVFVGRQHRLHPADAFEAARHEALMCAVEELRDTMTPALRITDPEQKRQAREALAANELRTWGGYVERQLGDGPFVGGAMLQVADLKLYGGTMADHGDRGSRAHYRVRRLPEATAAVPCSRRARRREGLVGQVCELSLPTRSSFAAR